MKSNDQLKNQQFEAIKKRKKRRSGNPKEAEGS